MIEGESFLCFAPEPWQHIWRNRHQIMSRLAKRNRVLFVEPRPYLREVWRDWRAGKLGWNDLRRPRITSVQEGLWAYHPPLYAPLSSRFPLNVAFRWLRETQMKRILRKLGFDAPILWLVRPNMADVVGRFGEKLVVYHVVDKYVAYDADCEAVYSAERRANIERQEEALTRAADLVIVASDSLWREKLEYNANTHWVPNGVDFEVFLAASREPLALEDVAPLPKPIVGYVGAINEKLDYGLLRRVAQAFPHCSLIMVGPVDLRLDDPGLAELNLPNVHFLGAKSVAQVPHYIAHCQVCLMPYKLNEWTAHINPLKLYEYLAEGKPIVSTAIPAVHDYGEVVRIARDAGDFCAQVSHALAEKDTTIVCRRQEVASRNTWDARVEEISRLLQMTLERKRSV